MKEQTFIVCLEDSENRTVDFERFGDKRLNTVLRKYTEFMKQMKERNWFMQDIKNTSFVRIYQTPYETTEQNRVYNITFSEFMQSLS